MTMRKPQLGLVLISLTLITGCAPAPAPPPVTAELQLFAFQPAQLEVPAGTTVTWTNHDDIEHSVTSGLPPEGDGVFDSDFFVQGETFAYTFGEPGDYALFCRRHNSMMGVVQVKAGP